MSNPDIKTDLPDWLECVRISELPAVHEVIQAFADDPTGDQGVMIVRAVLEASANAEWLTTAHIICSEAGIAHGYINDRLNALRDHIVDANKMVPPEPSAAMLDAAVAFALNVSLHSGYGWTDYMRDLWKVMMQANQREAHISHNSAHNDAAKKG